MFPTNTQILELAFSFPTPLPYHLGIRQFEYLKKKKIPQTWSVLAET